MTTNFLQGMRHVARLASRTAAEKSSASALVDYSYRYHIPRRISTRGFSSHHGATAQALFLDSKQKKKSPPPTSQSDRKEAKVRAADGTPISLYLGELHENGNSSASQETSSTSRPPHGILNQIPKRAFHTSTRRTDAEKGDHAARSPRSDQSVDKASSTPPEPQKATQEHFYDRLHMPQFHRPTKEELLAAATGFWSRLKVRFKWLTIKSVRPFNMDEIFGFFSWILLGHVVWIIVGTTTFVSLAILAINTVFAQETLAGWVGNYLTKSSGVKVVFESAIVPKWSGGVITFKNVFVSRRPGPQKSKVTKGSPEAAAAEASAEEPIPDEDQNYTQFDVNIGEVNVTLSFNKWWNSKGLLKDVEVKHVRGVIDRTHVFWTGDHGDPKSWRHEHVPGDFEIESFKVEDLLLSLHQPHDFRPFTISLYNAELPRLRKHWLFYDFLCANNMSGEFDGSLFTIHQRQLHSFTGAPLNDPTEDPTEPWKKQSRIRLDALNIDHLNRGVEGPFGWITEGNVDIVADIMVPNDDDESALKIMTDFYDRLEATLTSRKHLEQVVATTSETPSSATAARIPSSPQPASSRYLVMDLRIHLNDVRASVPIFTRDLSYINNALIRPIVAYINSRRTFIPINCRVVKRASDFDGSWTIYDSCLMDDLSAEVYDAFARDVTDDQARMRRFKAVGMWGAQLALQALFLGMAGGIA
ncbi:Mitochondrial distribution and morphology protein 31 [Cyphellophora attinorum]|uniref:Mitochondrial distribution and morphology protein 31 n=1 Tax=Cyphellophora attinorum TaxID=1664694 RepID=A0A0N0NM36_9EURO|nr:Mitochondrial distribution and morphology protein 31 [Phialophora attinorum]KPI39749.1 Mitochondrial distribution and morphology protein 31 [Phialophora attinorum]